MPERPKPDMDHTREALRKHDARVDAEEPDSEDTEPDEDDEQEPEPPE
jgi:hypothetical protein